MAGALFSGDAAARPDSMNLAASSILVLCTPGADLTAVQDALSAAGFVVLRAQDANEIEESAPLAHYAIVELSLAGARELLRRTCEDGAMAIAVVASAEHDDAALAAGAIATLRRPLHVEDVLLHLQRFREHHERAAIQQQCIERERANAGVHLLERGLASVASDLLPRMRASGRLLEAARLTGALEKGATVQLIDEALRSLDEVTDRILAVAGLGAQAAPWVKRVPLHEITRKAVGATLNASGVPIQLEAGSQVWAWGDAPALERVVRDLLAHALETVPRRSAPGVRIRVYGALAEARISIRYEHPKIHASDREALFVPFLSARSGGGDGLALVRARHAVAHMGGALALAVETPSDVVFRIRLRKGSAFVAAGETEPAESKPPPPAAGSAQERPEVLVVEDDLDTLSAIADALDSAGYAVSRSHNGREALAAIATRRPAAMLVDLMMPVMDGWQLLDALKGTPEYANVPVVVFSAMTQRRPIATSFVAKPMRLDTLIDAVRTACEQGALGVRAGS